MTRWIDPAAVRPVQPQGGSRPVHEVVATRIARALPHELLGHRIGITARSGGDDAAQLAADGAATPRLAPSVFGSGQSRETEAPDGFGALVDAAPGAFGRLIGGGPVDDLFA